VKQDFDQFKELPAPLPVGERVIWQGKPSFKGLALRSFHIREVAIYFGLLMAWKLWSNWWHGASLGEAATSVVWLVAPAVSAIAVLAGLAWLFRRAACYTITTKRVLFQFGVALPMTMNVPLSKIASAALKNYRDGSGDIPLGLSDSNRVSYVLLWPHIRPWRLRTPEPMLRALPDAAMATARLSEALTGQPGPPAIALSQSAGRSLVSDAAANTPSTVAA
jgi:Bacterial PH domain